MSQIKSIDGKLCKLVFARYVVRNGKVIFPKNAKVFCFWVPVE